MIYRCVPQDNLGPTAPWATNQLCCGHSGLLIRATCWLLDVHHSLASVNVAPDRVLDRSGNANELPGVLWQWLLGERLAAHAAFDLDTVEQFPRTIFIRQWD